MTSLSAILNDVTVRHFEWTSLSAILNDVRANSDSRRVSVRQRFAFEPRTVTQNELILGLIRINEIQLTVI
jgi:hypothetical protein